MSNNLHPILLIQFDIFKHGEKEWNKIILVISTMLSINLLSSIIKYEEKEWNKIILVINIMLSNNLLSSIIKYEEKE